MLQVVGTGRSKGHRRGRDALRLCQEGKGKRTESAREFPKAFRLAEPERVAPGVPEHLPAPPPQHFSKKTGSF